MYFVYSLNIITLLAQKFNIKSNLKSLSDERSIFTLAVYKTTSIPTKNTHLAFSIIYHKLNECRLFLFCFHENYFLSMLKIPSSLLKRVRMTSSVTFLFVRKRR